LPPLLQSAELDGLRVVLVSTRNPLNLGAAARAMSNFGALRLRVVNPYEVAFREARSAVGAAANVLANAEEYTTLAEAVADCGLVVGTTATQHRELRHSVYRLDEGAALVRQQMAAASVAIVFGSEKSGLRNEELAHCHWLIQIPTRDEHLSMNLGQAVAVTLYELSRQPAPLAGSDQPSPVTGAELERLTTALLNTLQLSGYATLASLGATEEKVRRLLRRMSLDTRDAELLLGMLRQIDWKLRSSPDKPKP
jgi:TrmH family RNA methyltransferase